MRVQCDETVVGGMNLNTVVIVTCFVASVMLSLLINDVCTLIVRRVVLIFVSVRYKSSSLIGLFPLRKLAHAQRVKEHSAAVVPAHRATVDRS